MLGWAALLGVDGSLSDTVDSEVEALVGLRLMEPEVLHRNFFAVRTFPSHNLIQA